MSVTGTVEEKREKLRAYRLKYQADGRSVGWQRKQRYGVTPAAFAAMLAEQGGQCAACGQPFAGRTIAVDHCHATRKVRGLIHRQCNSMIGLARESADILESAARYLRRCENA